MPVLFPGKARLGRCALRANVSTVVGADSQTRPPSFPSSASLSQLIVSALALQSKSDTPTIISLAGNMVLYEICNLIGAMTVAPYKFMWWVAGLIFLGLVFMVLMQRLNNPEGYGGENLQVHRRVPCSVKSRLVHWQCFRPGLPEAQRTGLLLFFALFGDVVSGHVPA